MDELKDSDEFFCHDDGPPLTIEEQDEVKDSIMRFGERLNEIADERLRKFREGVAGEGLTAIHIDEISPCCWFIRATPTAPPDASCCRRVYKSLRRVARLLDLKLVPHGIQVTRSGDRVEAVVVHYPPYHEVRSFSLYLIRRFRRAARYERDALVD